MTHTKDLELNKQYSYKELCELLDEEQKGGNSKKAQLKEWETYFKFEKAINPKTGKLGNKFIITEIYDEKQKKQDNRINNGRPSIYYEDFMKVLIRLLYLNDGFLEMKTSKFYTELGLKSWVDEETFVPDWDTELNYDYLNDKMYDKRRYIVDSSLAKAYKEELIYYGHDLYILDRQAYDWEVELYEACKKIELRNIVIDGEKHHLTSKQLHGIYKKCIGDYYMAVKERFISLLKIPDIEPADINKRYWVKWKDVESLRNMNIYDINTDYAEGVKNLNYAMQNALYEAIYKYKEKHKKSDVWYENNLNRLDAYTAIEGRIQRLIDIYD